MKQLIEIKELTPELIHEFIDKIVVYAPKYLDGKRYQVGVGILRAAAPGARFESPTGTKNKNRLTAVHVFGAPLGIHTVWARPAKSKIWGLATLTRGVLRLLHQITK